MIHLENQQKTTSPSAAGFPSPADDFIDQQLDLTQYVVKHPVSTYFMRVSGRHPIIKNLADGDILVVDRSLEPKNENIIVANIEGKITINKVTKYKNSLCLLVENPINEPTKIDNSLQIWGVVTHVISRVA